MHKKYNKNNNKPKLAKPVLIETDGEINKNSLKDVENNKSKFKSTVPDQKPPNEESELEHSKFKEIEANGYRYYRSILITDIPSFKINSNESNPFYGTGTPNIDSLEKLYQQLEKKFSSWNKVLWIHVVPDQDKAVITFEKSFNTKQLTDLRKNIFYASKLNNMDRKYSNYLSQPTFLAQYSINYDLQNCFPKLNDDCFLNMLKYLNFYDHIHLFFLSVQNRKLIFKYYESTSTLRINRKDIDLKALNLSWYVLEIIGPSINKIIFEYGNCYDLGMEGFIQSILYYTKNIKELKIEKEPKSDLLILQYFIKEKKIFEELKIINIQKFELIGFGNRGQELSDLDIKNLANSLPALKILNLSKNENITGQHFYRFKSIIQLNIEKCYKILCCHMMEFFRFNNNKLEYLNIIDCLNLCGNVFWDYIQTIALNLRTIKFSIMPSLKLPNQLHNLANLKNLTEVFIGNGENVDINYNDEILDVLEILTLSKCVRRVEIDSTIRFRIKIFLFIVNLLKKDKIRQNNTNKIHVKLGVTYDEECNFQTDEIYLENRKNIKFFHSIARDETNIMAAEYTFQAESLDEN